MSHLKLKVGGNTGSSGDISLSLSDLSDVSLDSIQENELLTYDGSTFSNVESSAIKGYELKFSAFQDRGSSYNVSYSSSKRYSVGDYAMSRMNTASYEKYAVSGFSLNTATTPETPITNSAWAMSFDVNVPGTYLITATGICRDSGDNITYQLETGAGAFSAKIRSDTNSFFGALAAGILVVPTGSYPDVRLVVKDVTGDVAISSIQDQDFFTFNILKLA